jgi:hypothetical protein
MPVEDAANAFTELKSKGILCTPAMSAAELTERQWPVRVVGVPATDPDRPSVISFGPFALDRERFDMLKEAVEDSDQLRVLLGFVRLEFEKTGLGATDGYVVEAEEDDLDRFLATMAYWDIDQPVIGEDFVWILPTVECRRLVEQITEESYSEDDYSWWDVRVDLGEGIKPRTAVDYPDRYSAVPNALIDSWMRYLPSRTSIVLMSLYQQATQGGTFKALGSFSDTLAAIVRAFEQAHRFQDSTKLETSYPDRELLIKELHLHNELPYPVDAATTLDYLQRIGFIVSNQSGTNIEYSLIEEPVPAHEVIAIPTGWEEKTNKFLATGSILFAYLSLEEIVTD